MQRLNEISASEAVRRLAARDISAEQIVRACLDRIEAREATVGAWMHVDADAALAQARQLDSGSVRGPLHGLPVGVKDLIDTADMPTGYGSPIYAGHRPRTDAACVALARAAGALVLGKTVTTEFAWFHPGKTTNPRNPAHTPGGSSSGSAAAVADCMVPIAFGTQTAGSIIRPASYCGVVGYKPSHATLPRAGVKPLSASLDTVGALARTVDDLALFMSVLSRRELQRSPLAQPPRIAICRSHEWDAARPESRTAMEYAAKVAAGAGAVLTELDLPPQFAQLLRAQIDIMSYESRNALAGERVKHAGLLSEKIRQLLDAADAVSAQRYDEARALAGACRAMLGEALGDADALLTPSAPGEAPAGIAATGDPVFCRIWTLLHVPAVSVPCGNGPGGLPVGVQVIGRVGDDARTLAVAAWLQKRLT